MLGFIADKLGLSAAVTAAGSGVLAVVLNLIMSKFKVQQKVKKWLDQIENAYIAWLDSRIAGIGKLGFNLGVWITALPNNTPIISRIWENAIEPLFKSVLRFIKSIVTTSFDKLTTAVSRFIAELIDGLDSDNKETKKDKE